MTITRPRTITSVVALAAAAMLLLGGCATTAETPTADAASAAADSLTITDGWVKSAPDGMSAAFGVLTNSSDTDIVVEEAETPASTMVELHETVANDAGEMVMQPKEGGFTVPAGGSIELMPGGNHIMLMGLTAPIVAGDEVSFMLHLSDGSHLEFTVPAKDFTGANETYEGDMDMGN